MAINLFTERILSLPQAAKVWPSYQNGKATHVSRLVRALTRGSKDPSGNLIKLEALRLGGQWVTSAEAIQRFAERLTPSDQSAAPRCTPVARRRAAESADSELERLGI
jgi:hypothetical protein